MKFTDFLLLVSINLLSYGLPIGASIIIAAKIAAKILKDK